MMRLLCRITPALIIFIFYATSVLADGGAIGHVIKVTPGAFAVRDGQTIELALKDALYANDVINTDASGKVQIIFTDDSSVSIGNASSFHMRDYVAGEAEACFDGVLTNGMVRVVTGFIVEQNPEAFRVSTPLGTAGIRGTIVSLRHQEQHSTIWVENTSKIVLFNGVSLHEGLRMDITPDGHTVSAITGQDLDTVEQETQISRAPSSGGSSSRVFVEQRNAFTTIYRETDTNAYSLQSDGDYQTIAVIDWDYLMNKYGAVTGSQPLNPLPSIPAYTNDLINQINTGTPPLALVTGSLHTSETWMNGFTGIFSFRADLGTGAITEGEMRGRWDDGNSSYSITGGTGLAAGTTANVTWTNEPTVVVGSAPGAMLPGNSHLDLNGNWDQSNATLTGTYNVAGGDSGTANGGVTIVTK